MSTKQAISIPFTVSAVALLLFSSLFIVKRIQANGPGDTIILFEDDFEDSNKEAWTTEEGGNGTCPIGEWTNEEDLFVSSPTHVWNMSPYSSAAPGDDCHDYLIMPTVTVPLTVTTPFTLTFFHTYFTEGGSFCNPPEGDPPCDYGEIEISVNDGPWVVAAGRFDDLREDFPTLTVETVDLSSRISSGDEVRIRWHFRSDFAGDLPFLGWWVDDVTLSGTEVADTPTAVALNNLSQTSTTPLVGICLLLIISTVAIFARRRYR